VLHWWCLELLVLQIAPLGLLVLQIAPLGLLLLLLVVVVVLRMQQHRDVTA
jgi:hypothetical protein